MRGKPPSKKRRRHWRAQALALIGMAAVIDQTLEHARFAGDFVTIAAGLGWTSGPLWKRNPAIKVARAAYIEAGNDLVGAARIVREASGKGILRLVSAGAWTTTPTPDEERAEA